jgi:hypothetical protein
LIARGAMVRTKPLLNRFSQLKQDVPVGESSMVGNEQKDRKCALWRGGRSTFCSELHLGGESASTRHKCLDSLKKIITMKTETGRESLVKHAVRSYSIVMGAFSHITRSSPFNRPRLGKSHNLLGCFGPRALLTCSTSQDLYPKRGEEHALSMKFSAGKVKRRLLKETRRRFNESNGNR